MASTSDTNAKKLEDEIKILQDETPETKIMRLKNKREELLSLIRSIDDSLAEDGYVIDPINSDIILDPRQSSSIAKQAGGQTGIRINGVLSFRGKEKAEEYFQRMDEDGDGFLSFQDFRAMKACVHDYGIAHEPEYLDWEAWRMYMDDIGVKTNSKGLVDVTGFIKYRYAVESSRPLARELAAQKLGFLPHNQDIWTKLKVLAAEIYTHRKITGTNQAIGELLDLDDVAFMLTNVGIVYGRHELVLNMIHRARCQLLAESLQRKSLRTKYGQSPHRYAQMLADGVIRSKDLVLTLNDAKLVHPSKLASWLFARSPKPLLDGIYRTFVEYKYLTYRTARYLDQWSKVTFDVFTHLRQRFVYRDFKPVEKILVQPEKTFIQTGMSFGNPGNPVEEGIGFAWSMVKLTRPEDLLIEMKLPREGGTTIVFDFLLKSDVNKKDAKKTADSLNMFLRSHFDDELRKNLQYRGIFAFPAENLGDGAPVLRVALVYKKIVSVDACFEHMYIPYKFSDLCVDMSGDLKTSVTLPEILLSATISLDVMLTARLDCRLTLIASLVQPLLQRTWLALSAGLTQDQVIEPENAEELREVKRWRALRGYFPTIVNWCRKLYACIQGMRSTTLNFKYKSLSEMLTLLGSNDYWFRKNFPPHIGKGMGLCQQAYDKWKASTSATLSRMFTNSKKFLDEQLKKEEAERLRVLMLSRQDQAAEQMRDTQASVVEKLRRLGMDVDNPDLFKEDAEDCPSYAAEVEGDVKRADIQALILYERLLGMVTGLHNIEVITGSVKLTCACKGLEFVEFLPEPPPMQAYKNDIEERKKAKRGKSPKKTQTQQAP